MNLVENVQNRLAVASSAALAPARENADAVITALLRAHPWLPRPLLSVGGDRGMGAVWSHARFEVLVSFSASGGMRIEILTKDKPLTLHTRDRGAATKFLSGWFSLRPERQQKARLFRTPEGAEQELDAWAEDRKKEGPSDFAP